MPSSKYMHVHILIRISCFMLKIFRIVLCNYKTRIIWKTMHRWKQCSIRIRPTSDKSQAFNVKSSIFINLLCQLSFFINVIFNCHFHQLPKKLTSSHLQHLTRAKMVCFVRAIQKVYFWVQQIYFTVTTKTHSDIYHYWHDLTDYYLNRLVEECFVVCHTLFKKFIFY